MKFKKFLLLILAVLATLTLCACTTEEETKEYVTPNVTNGTEVVFSKDNYSVNKELTYKFIKAEGGIDLLTEYIDSILLKDKIDEIRNGKDTTYKTQIDELKERYESDNYNDVMKLLGYEEGSDEYIYLLLARNLKAKEYVEGEITDYYSDYYITEDDLEAYYEDGKFDTFNQDDKCKAIICNFFSQQDFINAVQSLGCVIYNSEIRLFTGNSEKIAVERQYSNDNTRTLSSVETKEFFKDLYNSTKADGYKLNSVSDANTYKYDELNENAGTLADKLFALDEGEYTYMATKYTTTLTDYYSVIYKVEGSVDSYSELDDTEKANVKETYINALVDSSLSTLLNEFREECKLSFVDRDYQYSYDSSVDVTEFEGDSEVIFKINETEYTADQFYDYVETRNVNYYVLLASIYQVASLTNTYRMVYGDNQDITTNASLRKTSFVEELIEAIDDDTLESDSDKGFKLYQDGYKFSSYEDNLNYDSTLTDMLYSIVIDELFSSQNRTYYVDETTTDTEGNEQTLQIEKTVEQKILNDELYNTIFNKVIEMYSYNYYYLKAYDVTINFDLDGDFVADSIDVITNQEVKEEYEDALESLYDLIEAVADSATETSSTTYTTDIKSFIEDYNDASVDDDLYGEFKSLGLIVSYKQIGSGSIRSLSYTGTLTDEVKTELVKLYQNSTSSSKYHYSDELIKDENGYQFIYTEFQGSTTEGCTSSDYKPSFKVTTESSPYYNNDEDTNANDDITVTMSLQQLTYLAYYEFLNTMLTSSDDAADINVTSYPTSPSSTINSTLYSCYTKELINSLLTDSNFAYYLVASKLSDGSNEFSEYANIFRRASGIDDYQDLEFTQLYTKPEE